MFGDNGWMEEEKKRTSGQAEQVPRRSQSKLQRGTAGGIAG